MKLRVTMLTTIAEASALAGEWNALLGASQTPNPFALAEWGLAWARHFVPDGHLRLLALRSVGGQLVGLAPLYLDRRGAPPIGAARLRLLGARDAPDLTEMQQVLAAPRLERPVLRAVVRHCVENLGDWDWLEITLAPDQGWLEPQWLAADRAFVLHKTTWAYVILPLAETWEAQHTGLKRNVKESIRRSEHRIENDGQAWRVEPGREGAALRHGIATLVALNRARAAAPRAESHRDAFPTPGDVAFLRDAAPALALSGNLETLVLRSDSGDAAALLTLSANGTTFVAAGAVAPTHWALGPGTALLAEALRRAIARGNREVNFSSGPDRAKLRWSERLRFAQEFAVVRRGRRRTATFTAYWLGRAGRQVHKEAGWHRPGR